MFMKRNEIKNLNAFFASIKLNNFSKEMRSAIIKNHLKISKVVKETDELAEEIRKKLIDENQEEVQKLVEYRELYRISPDNEKNSVIELIKTKCQIGLRVESELIELIKDLENESVDIELIKFDREEFADEYANAGLDFTLSDLDSINVLFNE